MQTHIKLIRLLANGRFHSGQQLGQSLGISRTAVWKALRRLSNYGMEVHAVPGKGYRLAQSIELLEESALLEVMCDASKSLLSGLDIHFEISSTNTYLVERALSGIGSGYVCLAEGQTAGRGRRGRVWTSPFGGNIYFSVFWKFTGGPGVLSGLSLALAVATVRALREAGITGIELKWPNDVLWNGKKLAGILLEMTGESFGPAHVVAGTGLNVAMPVNDAAQIDQPWVDLETIAHSVPERNKIAGLLLKNQLLAMANFEQSGLAGFRDEWLSLDAFAGKPVVLQNAQTQVTGIVQGIDESGALILRNSAGQLHKYMSGEVSLRGLQ
jgi:BirA family biotin operon repressor/biotin-[acetyl-CoA-carboxylase] ligase